MPWSWSLPGAAAGQDLARKHLRRRLPELPDRKLREAAALRFRARQPDGTPAMLHSWTVGFLCAYHHAFSHRRECDSGQDDSLTKATYTVVCD